MTEVSRRSRRAFLGLAGTAVLGAGAYHLVDRAVASGGTAPGPTASPSASAASPVADPSTTPQHTPTTSPTPSPTPTLDRAALTRDLDRYLAERPGRLTLAVHERFSGITFDYRPKLRCFTASCVKVNILAALLLQAQADERRLTAEERELASPMIQVSDNDAANTFWSRIGGHSGLEAANRRLGLESTTPPTTVYWANTLTTAADQVRLLESLVRGGSPLYTTNRRYMLELMRGVVDEQSWGVSAVARDGDVVALKNGWFPTAFHDDLWVIDSIGRVRGPHRDLLVAVLSDHNPSSSAGIRTVEHAVELVARRLWARS